jgi:tetratricopeptide (TPR) repeat protein
MTEPTTDSQTPRGLVILLTIAAAGFAFLFSIEKVYNYDIWWHLKTGQWILEHGRIPSTDPFSFSTEGAPWVPHAWLSDVIFSFLYLASGIEGLILLKAAIIGTVFGIAYYLAVRRGANPYLAAFIIGAAVPIARFRFLLRPQIFMFLLVVLFFYLLSQYSRQRPRQLLILLPLMLFWVNAHASFILGILFTGFLLIEELVCWVLVRQGCLQSFPFKNQLNPIPVALLLMALILMVFVTPHGLALPEWIIQAFISTSVIYSIQVEEHAALAWGEHVGFWIMMTSTVLSFILAWRKIRIFDSLVFLATSYLAIRSVRYVGFAVVLHAIILAVNSKTLLDGIGFRWPSIPTRVQAMAFLPVLVLGGWFAHHSTFIPEKIYQMGLGIQESRYPVKAVDFLREADFKGNLFNSWKFGGYIQWFLPEARTLVDGRVTNAQMALNEELAGMNSRALGHFLNEQNVNAALLTQGDSEWLRFFDRSSQFELVFSDGQTALYMRQDSLPGRAGGGKGQVFQFIKPGINDFSYLVPLAKSPQAQEVEAELRHAIKLSPDSFIPHYSLGIFLEAQGRVEALDHYFDAADISSPGLGFVHFGLGERTARLAMKHKQWSRAQKILLQAQQFKGNSAELEFLLATTLYMSGELEKAESAFLELLADDPNQINVLLNLGFLYIDSGRFSDAILMFEQVNEHAPNQESAIYGLALALQGAGDERAAAYWRDFLVKFPQSQRAPKARSYLTP